MRIYLSNKASIRFLPVKSVLSQTNLDKRRELKIIHNIGDERRIRSFCALREEEKKKIEAFISRFYRERKEKRET